MSASFTRADIEKAHAEADDYSHRLRARLSPEQCEDVNQAADLDLEAVTLDLLGHRDRVLAAVIAGAGEFGPEIRRLADAAVAAGPEAWHLRLKA